MEGFLRDPKSLTEPFPAFIYHFSINGAGGAVESFVGQFQAWFADLILHIVNIPLRFSKTIYSYFCPKQYDTSVLSSRVFITLDQKKSVYSSIRIYDLSKLELLSDDTLSIQSFFTLQMLCTIFVEMVNETT